MLGPAREDEAKVSVPQWVAPLGKKRRAGEAAKACSASTLQRIGG